MLEGLPKIKKAALIVGKDNCMISASFGEDEFLEGVESILGADGIYYNDLMRLEGYLSGLTHDALTICFQGQFHDEAQEMWKASPVNAEGYPLVNLLLIDLLEME
jgi:hypothetical protein